MEIGKKLKEARLRCGLTQEQVAEEILVSRQTISNWENQRSYPDILSVVKLSDLYQISLDELLKGDSELMKHLEESTDTVRSAKKLLAALGLNLLLFALFLLCNGVIAQSPYLTLLCVAVGVVSITALFYQLIRRF